MIDYRRIAPATMESLKAYVDAGYPTGSFLRAVLCNDLTEACRRADPQNAVALADIVDWLVNHAPLECWGASENVEQWGARHRAERNAAGVRV